MSVKIWRACPQKMEPNWPVLQPAEKFSYFEKRNPDMWQLWNDGMAFFGIGMPLWFQWYGMKWHGIGKRGIWYGFSNPWYHAIGMEPIYHIGMGSPQGSLIQRIGWPHDFIFFPCNLQNCWLGWLPKFASLTNLTHLVIHFTTWQSLLLPLHTL